MQSRNTLTGLDFNSLEEMMTTTLLCSLLSRRRATVALLACAGLTILLIGCGTNPATGINAAAEPTEIPVASIQGRVTGGETPIYGAKVILWQTLSSGYPSATNDTAGTTAKELASTTTGANGIFSFNTPPQNYTCVSNQFAYITLTGGDVTDNSGSPMINNNLVMMAAIGPCSNLSSSTWININELSTVAAAYALDSFIYVDDTTPGSQLVYVSAPSNNNVATGACSMGATPATTYSCTAAGLSHAFANATNLVNAVGTSTSLPTGLAYTTLPGNSNASVPQAVISSLGDIMQYCTNSSGTITGAGDGTPCGNFFADATPPNGGAAPTDTLSAMINIARAPYKTVGGLFSLITGTPPWTGLSAAPHDWSIAIAYTANSGGSVSSSNTFGSPQWLTLDANDNVYVETSNAYTYTPATSLVGIAAMTNGGTSIWSNPWPSSPATTMCAPGELAVDNIGNLWQSVNTNATGCGTPTTANDFGIYEYTASTGTATASLLTSTAIVSTPDAIAFDRFNNLWYGRNATTCSSECVIELQYTAGQPYPTGAFTNYSKNEANNTQLFVGSNGYVWANGGDHGTPADYALFMMPNTGTAASPTYTGSSLTYADVYVTPGSETTSNSNISLDSSGNVWAANAGKIYEYTPTLTGLSSTSTFGSAVLTATTTSVSPTPGIVDGQNNYWYASNDPSGSIFLQITPAAPLYNSTAANNTQVLRPCYVPAGGITCDSTLNISSTQYYLTSYTHNLVVDSAGAIWVSSGAESGVSTTSVNTGYVVEILGAAYPTWPLINYAVYGTEPQ